MSQKSVDQCCDIITKKIGPQRPETALILGSGLGDFANHITDPCSIDYGLLPGFPAAGVAGHQGRLHLGSVGSSKVAVLQGRAHYYEHGRPAEMKIAVRTLAALGCETLILTNAAGSLNPAAGPGSVMLLTDHINFTGVSPLFNEHGVERFVDLVDAYDPLIRTRLLELANGLDITLHQGVYMWFCGPHFETPAEIRAARLLGADAVGMSTVPEVILARQAGMRVAGLSIITNYAAGMDAEKLSHQHTMKNAGLATDSLSRLLTAYLA